MPAVFAIETNLQRPAMSAVSKWIRLVNGSKVARPNIGSFCATTCVELAQHKHGDDHCGIVHILFKLRRYDIQWMCKES